MEQAGENTLIDGKSQFSEIIHLLEKCDLVGTLMRLCISCHKSSQFLNSIGNFEKYYVN